MILVLIFRFIIQLQFSILMINLSEFYPVSIRSTGIGFHGIFGCLGFSLSLLLFTDVEEFAINPFILISVISLIIAILYFWVPETKGT